MQAGNITSNIIVKLDFTLPALSSTDVMTCEFHVDEYDEGRYDMVLGRDILTELGLKLKFSEHVIEAGDGPLKGPTTPMVDLDT